MAYPSRCSVEFAVESKQFRDMSQTGFAIIQSCTIRDIGWGVLFQSICLFLAYTILDAFFLATEKGLQYNMKYFGNQKGLTYLHKRFHRNLKHSHYMYFHPMQYYYVSKNHVCHVLVNLTFSQFCRSLLKRYYFDGPK